MIGSKILFGIFCLNLAACNRSKTKVKRQQSSANAQVETVEAEAPVRGVSAATQSAANAATQNSEADLPSETPPAATATPTSVERVYLLPGEVCGKASSYDIKLDSCADAEHINISVTIHNEQKAAFLVDFSWWPNVVGGDGQMRGVTTAFIAPETTVAVKNLLMNYDHKFRTRFRCLTKTINPDTQVVTESKVIAEETYEAVIPIPKGTCN